MRLVVGVVGGGEEGVEEGVGVGVGVVAGVGDGAKECVVILGGGTSVTARFEGLKKGRRGRLFPFGEHGDSRAVGVTQILSSASAGLGS